MGAVYLLYSALLALAALVSAPWWLFKMLTQGKYRAGLAERLGRVPSRVRSGAERRTVWIHAVSVGEALAIQGLVERLRLGGVVERVVVSTTTSTGQKLARERFGEENVFYFPIDFKFAIRSYLRVLRPSVVVMAETEFWPNFLHEAASQGAHVMVVNARISDRSLPRYRQCRNLLSSVLANVRMFLAQSSEDARRLREIGAAPERVSVSGNLKFDAKPPAEVPFVAELREAVAQAKLGPVVVAGSTVEGEESIVLESFRALAAKHANALLVLAPRHKERFDTTAALVQNSGLAYSRRSATGASQILPGGVLLLDSIGELASVYSLANVAIVGGSFAPRGGHNILEPAYYAVATVIGPHTENFRDIVTLFAREEAVEIVNAEQLTPSLLALIDDDAKRERLGARAQQVLCSQQGATERTAQAIEAAMKERP